MLRTIWIDDEPYQFDPDELVLLGRWCVCINYYQYLYKTAGGSYLRHDVDGSSRPEDPAEKWRILSDEEALLFLSPTRSATLTEAGEKELESLLERFAVRL